MLKTGHAGAIKKQIRRCICKDAAPVAVQKTSRKIVPLARFPEGHDLIDRKYILNSIGDVTYLHIRAKYAFSD